MTFFVKNCHFSWNWSQIEFKISNFRLKNFESKSHLHQCITPKIGYFQQKMLISQELLLINVNPSLLTSVYCWFWWFPGYKKSKNIMIIDQWGFYDPGYFPEDKMTLDVMTLHKSSVRNDLKMTLFSTKKKMKWIIYPCFTCFWIKNSTFDFILAGFYFLVFAIIAYLAGIDMMELFILFQTHSIYPITAFQYRFQAENNHDSLTFPTFWGQGVNKVTKGHINPRNLTVSFS